MKIVLAGYNVDTHVLEHAASAGVPKEHLTPEMCSEIDRLGLERNWF